MTDYRPVEMPPHCGNCAYCRWEEYPVCENPAFVEDDRIREILTEWDEDMSQYSDTEVANLAFGQEFDHDDHTEYDHVCDRHAPMSTDTSRIESHKQAVNHAMEQLALRVGEIREEMNHATEM